MFNLAFLASRRSTLIYSLWSYAVLDVEPTHIIKFLAVYLAVLSPILLPNYLLRLCLRVKAANEDAIPGSSMSCRVFAQQLLRKHWGPVYVAARPILQPLLVIYCRKLLLLLLTRYCCWSCWSCPNSPGLADHSDCLVLFL
ncbi:hypothetical protein BDZ89DRAFT_1129889 [Hymenopellis radicata]|nr:hypothetical protein BDZ89DRAFT_1129889 [Hymenopellis radicata]